MPRKKREVPAERIWSPPEKSDQPPGEEVVQVNDTYSGTGTVMTVEGMIGQHDRKLAMLNPVYELESVP